MTDCAPPPCIHQGHTVRKTWVIVQKPGCVPETKSPMKQSWEGLDTLIRELIEHRPEGTKLTLARLSYAYDLWVEDAREYLKMGERMKEIDASAPTCAELEPDQHY